MQRSSVSRITFRTVKLSSIDVAHRFRQTYKYREHTIGICWLRFTARQYDHPMSRLGAVRIQYQFPSLSAGTETRFAQLQPMEWFP